MGILYNQASDVFPSNHFCDIEGFPVIGKWAGDEKLFTYEGYELGWPNDWHNFGRRWYEVLMPAYYLSSNWAWKWWDVKLAAAINLATNACGLSKDDLMPGGLGSQLMRFHVYYTVASTMYITQTPIPGDIINFKVCDQDTDEKLWRNYFHELGVSSDGASYAREPENSRESVGLVGLYWDSKQENCYWLDKTQNKKRIYFNESHMDIKSYRWADYVKKRLSGVNTRAAKWFNKIYPDKEHLLGDKWLTMTYSYNKMKQNMHFANNEWNAIINDKSGRLTSLGKLLINKSLMVYTYSMYAALSSPHGGNVQIIRQQFIKTVNAFIHDEKNMASRDLIKYYDIALSSLSSRGDFEYADGYLPVIPHWRGEGFIKVPKFTAPGTKHRKSKPVVPRLPQKAPPRG